VHAVMKGCWGRRLQ